MFRENPDELETRFPLWLTNLGNVGVNDLEVPLEDTDSVASLPPLSLQLRQVVSSHPRSFQAVHINAQSFVKHIDEFKATFSSLNLHAILISESWLKPSLSNALLELTDYKIFRNDGIGKGAGGVMIYLRSDLKTKVLSQSSPTYSGETEFIILDVRINNVSILLAIVYRAPRNDFSNFESEICKYIFLYSHMIIMGDFNYDLLSQKE